MNRIEETHTEPHFGYMSNGMTNEPVIKVEYQLVPEKKKYDPNEGNSKENDLQMKMMNFSSSSGDFNEAQSPFCFSPNHQSPYHEVPIYTDFEKDYYDHLMATHSDQMMMQQDEPFKTFFYPFTKDVQKTISEEYQAIKTWMNINCEKNYVMTSKIMAEENRCENSMQTNVFYEDRQPDSLVSDKSEDGIDNKSSAKKMINQQEDCFLGDGQALYGVGSVGTLHESVDGSYRPVSDESIFENIFAAVDSASTGFSRASTLLAKVCDSDYGMDSCT
ncbi:hypothetical protein QYM36_006293, partial [Artemia franciscana]